MVGVGVLDSKGYIEDLFIRNISSGSVLRVSLTNIIFLLKRVKRVLMLTSFPLLPRRKIWAGVV